MISGKRKILLKSLLYLVVACEFFIMGMASHLLAAENPVEGIKDISIRFGVKNISEGLFQNGPDTNSTALNIGGKEGRQPIDRFIALRVSDDLKVKAGDMVVVIIEYFDQGRDLFYIQYDATVPWPFRDSDQWCHKKDTKTWKRFVFLLPDARFAHRMSYSGGTDILLDNNGDGNENFSSVTVRVLSKSTAEFLEKTRLRLFALEDRYDQVFINRLGLEDCRHRLLRQVDYNLIPATVYKKAEEAMKSVNNATFTLPAILDEAYFKTMAIADADSDPLPELNHFESALSTAESCLNSAQKIFSEAGVYSSQGEVFRPTGKMISKADLKRNFFFGGPIRETGHPPFDRKMKNLGFNFIDMGLYTGTMLNMTASAPDIYNFSFLDQQIQVNSKNGLFSFPSVMDNGVTLPIWFIEKYGKDVLLQDEDGGTAPTHHGNVFHPAVIKVVSDFLQAMGERYRKDPSVVAYQLYGEPHLHVNWTKEGGYGDYNLKLFQEWLKNSYGTIDNLNLKWHTSYGSFDKIIFPPDYITQARKVPTGLTTDFESFRRKGFADFMRLTCQAMQEKTPNQLVMDQFVAAYNSGIISGHDTLQLSNAGWDVFSLHDGFGGRPGEGWIGSFVYLYSLGRYLKDTPLWSEEYIWSCPESCGPSPNEDAVTAAAQRNFWQHAAWGKTGFSLFTPSSWTGGDWNNYILDKDRGHEVLRPAAASISLMINKLNEFRNVFLDTKIIQAPLALIQPSLSTVAAYPYNTVYDEMGGALQDYFFRTHTDYFIVPEECLMDGRDSLSLYKAAVLPYATVLPEGLSQKLLGWVKAGGNLFLSGPAGVYDRFGNDDLKLMGELFGIEKISYDPTRMASMGTLSLESGQKVSIWKVNKFLWHVDQSSLRQDVKVLGKYKDGSPGILEVRYGKGRAVLSLLPIGHLPPLGKVLRDFLYQSIPVREASADSENVELILRENSAGQRFLIAVNLDASSETLTHITLGRSYEKIIDVQANSKMAIPVFRERNATSFKLRLAPGEGIILSCGKPGTEAEGIGEQKTSESDKGLTVEIADLKSGIAKSSGIVASVAATYLSLAKQLQDDGLIKESETITKEGLAALKKPPESLTPSEKSLSVEAKKLSLSWAVDGDLSKWKGVPFYNIINQDGQPAARFALNWDDQNLRFICDVNDEVLVNLSEGEGIWQGDCLEFYIDVLNREGGSYQPGTFQYMFDVKGRIWLNGPVQPLLLERKAVCKVKPRPGGYVLEGAVPWADLFVNPVPGRIFAFNLRIFDSDDQKTGKLLNPNGVMWRPTNAPYALISGWGKLVLAK